MIMSHPLRMVYSVAFPTENRRPLVLKMLRAPLAHRMVAQFAAGLTNSGRLLQP
jgi:hypothetical protein